MRANGRRAIWREPPPYTAYWAPLMVIAILMAAFFIGQRMHAVEHALIADEEEAENQIICSRLDMPLASAGYSVCSANLATVRQRQRERLGRLSFGPG